MRSYSIAIIVAFICLSGCRDSENRQASSYSETGESRPVNEEKAVQKHQAADESTQAGNKDSQTGANPVICSPDKNSIEKVIQNHLTSIRSCANLKTAQKTDASNLKLNVLFRIESDGRVSEISIETDGDRDPGVEKCVIQAFKEIKFDKPRKCPFVLAKYPVVL